MLGATAGTLFALAGILDYFIPFLVFLSLIIPPIAAIYVIDSFTLFRDVETEGSELIKPAIRWEAIGVWVASVAFTLAVPAERFTLTTVPALDATIIAGFGYVAVLRLKQFWAARRATSAL